MPYDADEFSQYIRDEVTAPRRSSFGLWAAIAAPVAAGGIGFMPYGKGRVWDLYFKGLQHIEGLSPFGFLRTFRLSEMISPLAAPVQFAYKPSEYSQLLSTPAFQDYMSRISGVSVSGLEELRAFERGIEFRRTGASLGHLRVAGGGPLLAENVALLHTGYGKGMGRIGEWFARVMGMRRARDFLTPVVEGTAMRAPAWVPIAHPKGKAQLVAQYAHAAFASGIGRLNLILKSPFQYESIRKLVEKVPALKKLTPAIKEGTAIQMLGRYTKKAAWAYLGFHAIKYLDYLQREEGGLASLPRNLVVGGGIGLALTGTFRGAGIGGAVLAGAGLLPIFKEGFVPGLAGMYARARVDLARLTSPWRGGAQRAEENYPGITKLTTLVGMAGTGLLLGGAWEYKRRLGIIRSVSKVRGKLYDGAPRELVKKAVEDVSTYEIAEHIVKSKREQTLKRFAELASKKKGLQRLATLAEGRWKAAPRYVKGALLGIGAYESLTAIGNVLSGDILGGITGIAATIGAGALWARGTPLSRVGSVLALLAPFALRDRTPPEKLERMYSGEELVPIRRGRWWELSKTPWEGRRPYYRPHRVALARKHAREIALYGSEKTAWETDPVLHPLKFLLDPYKRERIMWKQGWRFPVTATPFEDFPILGPVLAATIGRVIKPPRLIEPEMWLPPESIGEAPPGYEITPPQRTIMRTGILGTIGEQIRAITEASGLPGFTAESIKERLTGRESWFPMPQHMTPTDVAGMQAGYWSLSLGGLAMVSEGVRRFLPKRRTDIELVNPLPSGLPSWLPTKDSGYFFDFSRADIYTKIQEPWLRLPGAGYGALHPEVAGVRPEDYPAYWRFRVLCLDPSTRVFVSDGIKEVKDIDPGDLVYGEDCCLKEVLIKKSRKGKEPRHCIRTYYNNDYPLICSGQHKVLVSDINGEVEEIEAASITKEHYLLFPKRKSSLFSEIVCLGDYCDVSDVTLKYEDGEYWAHVKGSQNFIRFNLPATYKTGRIFGLYLAEGSSSKASSQVTWCLHEKEKNTFAKEIKEFARFIGLNWHERDIKDSKAYQVSINNKLLGRFLNTVFGSGAKNKHLGLDVTKFSDDFVFGLIDGYFGGDGNLSVCGDSITLRAASISRDLLDQMRFLLASLGITSAIRSRKGDYKERGFYKLKGSVISDSWTLDVIRRDIKKLPAFSGLNLDSYRYRASKSKKFGFELDEYIALRVKDLWVEGGETEWVDIAINDPLGDRRFVTVHGLVHNSDLAPWSKEYTQHAGAMTRMAEAGQLTPAQMIKVHETKQQVLQVRKRREFQPYKYDTEQVRRQRVRIQAEVEPGVYLTNQFGKAPIVMAGVGVTGAGLARIALQEDSDISKAEAFRRADRKRTQVSDFLREHLYPGAEIDVFVHRDPSMLMRKTAGGPVVPAVVVTRDQENLNLELIRRGLAEKVEEDTVLSNMAAVDQTQRAFGSFWENLMHGMETPLEVFTPIAPTAKFIHQRTAFEDYLRSRIYAREVAMWEHPVSHFIAPGLKTTAWWFGWRDLPAEVRQRYMVQEYFDRLEYMKMKRLESVAAARGMGDAAVEFRRKARRTMTGVNPFSPFDAFLAVPKEEKDYFRAFVEAPTREERKEIARVVSPQMRRILEAQWLRREAEGARMRMEAGIGGTAEQRVIAAYNEAYRREQSSQPQLPDMPVPGPDWVGFSGQTNIRDFQLKTVMDMGMEYHDFSFWPTDIRKIERMPYVQPVSAAFASGPPEREPNIDSILNRYRRLLRREGQRGADSYTRNPYSGININVLSPGYDRLDRYLRDPTISTF